MTHAACIINEDETPEEEVFIDRETLEKKSETQQLTLQQIAAALSPTKYGFHDSAEPGSRSSSLFRKR
jgi:hypothetical protein